MTKKVALVDLDRVVVNSTKRFDLAQKAKESFLEGERKEGSTPDTKEANDIYWGVALNGDNVYLDDIIPEAPGQLNTLEALGYEVIFFTARPEWSMREGTVGWLEEWHLLKNDRIVIMRPESERWTKTPKWKAASALVLATKLEVGELLVVDSEKANTDALLAQAHGHNFNIAVYSSLQEALDALAIAHGGEEQREESGPSTIDMIIDLLDVDTNELEAGQRVYTSSASYDISRYHIIEKQYNGIQIDQTETGEKWGKRVNFHTDEIPGLLKTLLNWYLEDELKKIADSADEDEHLF